MFQRAIDAVYEDPGVSVFVYVMTPQPLMPETIEHLITLWRRQHKPVVVVMNMAGFGHSLRERLVDAGLPFVTRTDDLFRAVSLLLAQADSPRTLRASLPSRPATVPAPADRAELPVGALTEPQAKALASHYGIAVPGAAACASAAEAVAAARAFGHPVVLKGVAAGVVHKSELGLVRLGLEDDDDVASAFADIARAIEAAAPGQPIRIDVQQMIGPGVELIVGLSHEPGIGAQVVVGAGGLYVELLHDVAQMRAPVSPRQAGAMLRSLRIWPLLAGARGQPPAAVDALGEAIARLSWLASDLGDALVDFEINPLRVSADAVWALDARATLSPARPAIKP
ncbi:MAG: acetate--CoA ligase family protein [Burkholderiaceae bacterium]